MAVLFITLRRTLKRFLNLGGKEKWTILISLEDAGPPAKIHLGIGNAWFGFYSDKSRIPTIV